MGDRMPDAAGGGGGGGGGGGVGGGGNADSDGTRLVHVDCEQCLSRLEVRVPLALQKAGRGATVRCGACNTLLQVEVHAALLHAGAGNSPAQTGSHAVGGGSGGGGGGSGSGGGSAGFGPPFTSDVGVAGPYKRGFSQLQQNFDSRSAQGWGRRVVFARYVILLRRMFSPRLSSQTVSYYDVASNICGALLSGRGWEGWGESPAAAAAGAGAGGAARAAGAAAAGAAAAGEVWG